APPSPDRLDRLLSEDEAAQLALLRHASGAGRAEGEEPFDQEIGRALDARRELLRFDLEVELRLQAFSARSPDSARTTEPSQEVVHLQLLRDRVELAGIEREMGLRRSLHLASDEHLARLDEILLRRIGLERRIAVAEASLRFEAGPEPGEPTLPASRS